MGIDDDDDNDDDNDDDRKPKEDFRLGLTVKCVSRVGTGQACCRISLVEARSCAGKKEKEENASAWEVTISQDTNLIRLDAILSLLW